MERRSDLGDPGTTRGNASWLARRQARLRERVSVVLQAWLQSSLQQYEQVVTIDGVRAAAQATEATKAFWRWLPLAPLVGAAFLPGSLRFALLAGVVLLSFVAAGQMRSYVIAVTNRRVLLQRVRSGRGKPSGALMMYPRRNVGVVAFRPAGSRSWYSTLDLSVEEPSGTRRLGLNFHKVLWPKQAEAVRAAIEQQGPDFG